MALTVHEIEHQAQYQRRINEYAGFSSIWNQDIFDTKADFSSPITEKEINKCKSFGSFLLVRYSALGKDWLQKLDEFYARPLKDQLKEIFKTFTIIDEDGNVLLTLDTIDKATITYPNPQARRIHIVLDENLYK